MNSVFDEVITKQPILMSKNLCSISPIHFLTFFSVRVRIIWNIGDKRNLSQNNVKFGNLSWCSHIFENILQKNFPNCHWNATITRHWGDWLQRRIFFLIWTVCNDKKSMLNFQDMQTSSFLSTSERVCFALLANMNVFKQLGVYLDGKVQRYPIRPPKKHKPTNQAFGVQ